MNIQEMTHRNRGGEMAYTISFFLLIVLTRFFDITLFTGRVSFYICIAILLFFYFNCKKDEYKNKLWIGLVWLMIMGSVLYSKLFHDQPLFRVMEFSYFAMGLSSFCVFSCINLSYSDSIRLVKNFSFLFCICYLLQTALYPTVLFSGALDELSITEDKFRMRMACSVCSYCLFFAGVGDFMKKRNTKSLVYSFLGFLPIIIMGFRSLIALTIIFTIYLIIAFNRRNKINLLIYSILFALFSLLLFQLPVVQDKYDEMMLRQETDTFDNDDYIRYASFDYYSNIFDTPTEKLIGGGVPVVNKNLRSKNYYVSRIAYGYQFSLFWNDLGLIGFGFIFGFPSVILISFLVFRTIIRSKEEPLLFIRATLLTIYLGSIFTSQELYRAGNFLFIGLLMYTEYIYHKEKQIHEKLRKLSC